MVQTQTEGRCGSPKKVPTPTPRPSPSPSATPTQNTETNSVSAQAQQCKAQFESLYQKCDSQINDTSYSCDEKNDSGMNSVANTASQVALMLGQQTAASIQAACSKMGDVAQAANGAVAAYRLTCSNSIKDCRSSCQDAIDYAKQNESCLAPFQGVGQPLVANGSSGGLLAKAVAEDKAKRCSDFDAKVSQANQAIQNYGLTSANATQCANLTSGESTPPPEFCKANPTYPGCAGAASTDCNNPQVAATSKVCICSKNPTDPTCLSGQVAQDSGVGAGGGIDASSRLGTNNDAEDFSGDIPSTPPISQGTSGLTSGQPIDGKQGAGAPIGESSSHSANTKKDGTGKVAAADSANSEGGGGYYGGSGSAFPSSSGGSSEKSAYAQVPASSTSNTQPGSPDLRQFLPGGKYGPRQRGVAGASGPDGITGPHSNIWQKIQNRYQFVSPTLMP